MPQVSNYPRKPFSTAIEIAENVDKLGAKCSVKLLADKLGKKISGSFNSGVSAAIKHGLIVKDKNDLRLTDLYSNIKLAYTDEERQQNLQKAFLEPDTYKEILERFDGNEIPIDVLDKILIREYQVKESISQSVANNMIKGGESVGIINNGRVSLNAIDLSEAERPEETSTPVTNDVKNTEKVSKQTPTEQENVQQKASVAKKIDLANINKDVAININIQLSVPETTNEEVYDKFFAAMKKHLLS
jgi:hypothetical protein